MEDSYNYYTSTHHSTLLRTYYVALNRIGGPRITHLPANKPLGKLSTYVKSFTLGVPEHRSDAIIGRLFGINHIKHGIKHLCESGKELHEMSAKKLNQPECSSSSSSVSSSIVSSNIKRHHNHNHKNGVSHRRIAPATLIERNSHRRANNNCSLEECPKKKKQPFRSGVANFDSQEHKFTSRGKKNPKKVNKNNKSKIDKSQSLMTSPTTEKSSLRLTQLLPTLKRTTLLKGITGIAANYDDQLNDSSKSMPISSNAQTALVDEDDYGYDR